MASKSDVLQSYVKLTRLHLFPVGSIVFFWPCGEPVIFHAYLYLSTHAILRSIWVDVSTYKPSYKRPLCSMDCLTGILLCSWRNPRTQRRVHSQRHM